MIDKAENNQIEPAIREFIATRLLYSADGKMQGPDDMPSHLRCAITRTSENVPVVSGRLGLGTWQAIYVWEHRAAPHSRQLVVSIWGERG